MMAQMPQMPVGETGENEESIFMQWVWRACKRTFEDTPSVRFEVDRNSIRAHAKAVARQQEPAVRMYLLIEEANDWNICRTLKIDETGTRTPGDKNINFAIISWPN